MLPAKPPDNSVYRLLLLAVVVAAALCGPLSRAKLCTRCDAAAPLAALLFFSCNLTLPLCTCCSALRLEPVAALAKDDEDAELAAELICTAKLQNASSSAMRPRRLCSHAVAPQ
jgi:hypothetical protein